MPRQRNSSGKTAVYRSQAKTFSLAREIEGLNWTLLRVVRSHRTGAARQVRKATADAARALRRAGGAFPLPAPGGVVSVMPAWMAQ